MTKAARKHRGLTRFLIKDQLTSLLAVRTLRAASIDTSFPNDSSVVQSGTHVNHFVSTVLLSGNTNDE